MFGRGKLTHVGVATVVSCSSEGHSFVVKQQGKTHCRYDMVIDVHPDGAAPFRTEASHWFSVMLSPNVGDQIRVRCNPETKKVELEISDDPRYDADLNATAMASAREAQRQADLAAPPGTPPAGTSHAPKPDGGGSGRRFDPVTGQLEDGGPH